MFWVLFCCYLLTLDVFKCVLFITAWKSYSITSWLHAADWLSHSFRVRNPGKCNWVLCFKFSGRLRSRCRRGRCHPKAWPKQDPFPSSCDCWQNSVPHACEPRASISCLRLTGNCPPFLAIWVSPTWNVRHQRVQAKKSSQLEDGSTDFCNLIKDVKSITFVVFYSLVTRSSAYSREGLPNTRVWTPRGRDHSGPKSRLPTTKSFLLKDLL